ncbi:hypothetical protein KAW38_02540 [Candidatus Micrarchaeota archaeon]|nr:hypothetical protein [Candidatus Micrarchaeota archaeon]
MEYKKYPERTLRHWISAPFIYGLMFPMLLWDISLEIYHQICFRLYRIPLVPREFYIQIDRQRLSYLPWYEKITCAYCGYANGLASYSMRIAGETEKYWCSIKHKKKKGFFEPEHHKDFIEYGDDEAYKKL